MIRAGRIRGLVREERGVAMIELALAAPIVLAIGCYGIEIANLAIINLRINQVALALADNASRIGVRSGNAYQLREGDINDVLQGARLMAGGTSVTTYGRITLSSLENVKQSYDTVAVQRIHWQRCIGKKETGYDSSYGTTDKTSGSQDLPGYAGTAWPDGMGPQTAKVNAPINSGVIFVEVNYDYRPMFGTMYVAPKKLRYIASFIVRDNRDFKQIYNPAPPTGSPPTVASTCDKHDA